MNSLGEPLHQYLPARCETGVCIGCGRTIQEIAGRASMSEQERRAIMRELPARMQQLEEAKG